jgi:hypothetical protein
MEQAIMTLRDDTYSGYEAIVKDGACCQGLQHNLISLHAG